MPKHGHITGYVTWKCRCGECREAAQDYMRAWRERNADRVANYRKRDRVRRGRACSES